MQAGTQPLSILENDFRIKMDESKPLARQPIGFVARGGFSQARGQGMAFGVIRADQVQALLGVNKRGLN